MMLSSVVIISTPLLLLFQQSLLYMNDSRRNAVRLFIMTVLLLSLFPLPLASADDAGNSAIRGEIISKIVENTLGKGLRIISIDNPEKSPVEGWKQTRVWIESVYGETPVLFYSKEDGTFIFAGSIFSSSGENLTRRDVGETRAKSIEPEKMSLNPDYMIGRNDAAVKTVLWLGTDAYSKELFGTFYELYQTNRDKIVLYVKFYPKSKSDRQKMEALTCFKNESLAKGFQVIYDAHPDWGSAEDLEAFKKTGDPQACRAEQVAEDLRTAAVLKLPPHPIAFVNGRMVIEQPTREHIVKIAGGALQ